MKHHKLYHISEEVLNVLGRNLVLVAQAQRSGPGEDYQINPMDYPACHLLDSATITTVPQGYRLSHKNWQIDYLVVPGTASTWKVYEGMNPDQAKRFYLLSVGDPNVEICDWNTSMTSEYDPETMVATLINTSEINGVPVADSPFNHADSSNAFIFGSDDELRGIDFVGNITDGNKEVNFNSGGCRLDFFKISNGNPDFPILEKDDSIHEYGVDVVFMDVDLNPETFYFQPFLGMKNVSRYGSMPTLGINLQTILS